ncbi:hypothetical protein MASR2M66_08120 [Chloroflexota bacterium]
MDQNSSFEFSYRKWRSVFLRTTLIAACIVGLIALIPALTTNIAFYRILYISLYVVVLTVTFAPLPENIKSGVLVGLIYLLAVSGLSETGIRSDGRVFMMGAITLACLLFSWRAGYYMLGIASISYVVFGWLILSGRFQVSNPAMYGDTISIWLSNAISVLMLSVLIINGIRLTQTEYTDSEQRARSFFTDLSRERATLEQRVKERTEVLDKRTAQLQAVADVGKSITSYRDLSELLQQACVLISENFGYYHIGIFLLDDRKEFAVLAAANSEGGRKMLEKGHLLKVGETGIVGYVAENLRARIALDVGSDAVYFNNPDLPMTRSEMALPLVASGKNFGVLDVQSVESKAFVDDDIATLQILAEQLAVAIQNANLFEETAKALDSSRATYGQLSREAWGKMLRNQPKIGYLATPPGTAQLDINGPMEPAIAKAIETGDIILREDGLMISVPVKIRGQVIGAIRLKRSEIDEAWTQDEINLAIALADQLSGALESARLYRESLQRVSRESLVSDISARINASATREAIIRETVQELGQSLGNATVSFQLLEHSNGAGQAADMSRSAQVASNKQSTGQE